MGETRNYFVCQPVGADSWKTCRRARAFYSLWSLAAYLLIFWLLDFSCPNRCLSAMVGKKVSKVKKGLPRKLCFNFWTTLSWFKTMNSTTFLIIEFYTIFRSAFLLCTRGFCPSVQWLSVPQQAKCSDRTTLTFILP